MVGRQVGPYRVEERLGDGGMGVVYRAFDTRLDRPVALKFLSPELTRDPEAKERFLIEARAASRIDHANLCTVYGAGETDEGEAYLAMAYYDGETLHRRLDRGPLPVGEALNLPLQLARGLERAHEAGIVHRDVKPGNVMVTPYGEAKLLDFGLARLRDGAALTQEGMTLGTPAYMAPEQVRGAPTGPAADVWGLGAVTYEMLAGHPPFGSDPRSAPALILGDDPPSLAEARPDAPAELVAVVERALAKDPADRWPDAGAMRAALEAARRADSDSRMATVAAMSAVDPPAPARRTRGLAAALAVAATVAAAAGWWWSRSRTVETPAATAAVERSGIAVLPFEVRGDPEWEYLAEGLVDLLSTKLDGAGELRTADSNAVLAAARQAAETLDRPAAARRVAERLGTGLYVLGDVVAAAGRLHFSASLYDLDHPEPAARASVEGDGDELFTLIDSLTTSLLAERFAGPGTHVARTAALTSESLPAVKSYLQGESALRVGRFTDALAAFQAAVAEDPDFALAWYRVSIAAEWANRPDLVQSATVRAVELADRLSPRDRQLLEGRGAARRAEVERAERLYAALLRSHPDEIEAWSQLAELRSHYRFVTARSATESREPWEKVLEYEPDDVAALWHLARVASLEGRLDDVREIARRLVPLTPESERRLEVRALAMYATGDLAGEEELLASLADAPDSVLWLAAWNIAIATDALEGAGRVLELATRRSRPATHRAYAQACLAHLAVAAGRPTEARRRLALARQAEPALGLGLAAHIALLPWELYDRDGLGALRSELLAWDGHGPPDLPVTDAFHLLEPIHPILRTFALGMVEARLGHSEVDERIESLRTVEPGEISPGADAAVMARHLGHTVAAYRELLAGRPEAAVDALADVDLEQAVYNYNAAFASPYFAAVATRFVLARALLESGDAEGALRWLRTFGENSIPDRAYSSVALLLEAEALRTLGRDSEAAAPAERFLTLWADAEPETAPWLDRARTALEN